MPGPEQEQDELTVDSHESTQASSSRQERVWTFLIIGVVLLVAFLSFLFRNPTRSQSPSQLPQLSPTMVPLATGEEPITQLFTQAGCVVCHTIPGIWGADGRVGPTLLLGSMGSTRLADPDYRGQAKTVREYVVESILNPGAYVVPGYPDQVMPKWYGQKLSAGAVDKIVDYLERLTDDSSSSKS